MILLAAISRQEPVQERGVEEPVQKYAGDDESGVGGMNIGQRRNKNNTSWKDKKN